MSNNDIAKGGLAEPKVSSSLKKKDHVLLNNRPCEIRDISIVETNDCQVLTKLIAVDIFTNESHEESIPSMDFVDIPNVERRVYRVVDIADGLFYLSATFADLHVKLAVPSGPFGEKLLGVFDDRKNVFITTIAAMGEEEIVSYSLTPLIIPG
ncbi:Eukaryotic translation initiation factor 5A [Mortierella sp. GBA30]|nr:Eukaryotic translation initiation factor 5A [Mortierella sp. GBA30]